MKHGAIVFLVLASTTVAPFSFGAPVLRFGVVQRSIAQATNEPLQLEGVDSVAGGLDERAMLFPQYFSRQDFLAVFGVYAFQTPGGQNSRKDSRGVYYVFRYVDTMISVKTVACAFVLVVLAVFTAQVILYVFRRLSAVR